MALTAWEELESSRPRFVRCAVEESVDFYVYLAFFFDVVRAVWPSYTPPHANGVRTFKYIGNYYGGTARRCTSVIKGAPYMNASSECAPRS